MEREKIIRKKLESLCTLCGSKKHNELNYNHNKEEISEECGFIHKNEICLLGRQHKDILFKNKYSNRNNNRYRHNE